MAQGVHMRTTQEETTQQSRVFGLDPNGYHSGYRSSGRRHHHRHHHHHHRSHHRRWPWVLLVVVVVLVVAAGVEGYLLRSSAQRVKEKASEAMSSVSGYMGAVKTGDATQLTSSAQAVSASARELQAELATTPWNIAAVVPVIGEDVRSVRTIGDVLVDVSENAMEPLAGNAGVMNLSHLMGNGSVNVDVLQQVTSAIDEATPVIQRSANAIRNLPKAHIPQVANVLEAAREAVVGADEALGHASPLLPYLYNMLGGGGQTRRYLVLAANNAEIHSSGGFVGQLGIMTVNNGNIDMGDFSALKDVLPINAVSAGATEEEVAIFGEACDTHHGDHNIIPDFSRVGTLNHAIWQYAHNESVDGVISVDPVFLQRMLGLTGGIDTSWGVTVDGTNAASVLLNECLFWWKPDVCDQFYHTVASDALEHALANLGEVDTTQFLEVVTRSAEAGNFAIWMREAPEQEAITQAGFAWELPHDATTPLTGVYLNDHSTSKAAFYLTAEPIVGGSTKNADGSSTYTMTTTITYAADRSLPSRKRLPGYLKTYPIVKPADSSRMVLNNEIYLVAPEGGRIENVRSTYFNLYASNHDINWTQTTYQGLNLWKSLVVIDVGEKLVLTYDVVTSPQATEPLAVRVTPLAQNGIKE